jgi:hypothetical protein
MAAARARQLSTITNRTDAVPVESANPTSEGTRRTRAAVVRATMEEKRHAGMSRPWAAKSRAAEVAPELEITLLLSRRTLPAEAKRSAHAEERWVSAALETSRCQTHRMICALARPPAQAHAPKSARWTPAARAKGRARPVRWSSRNDPGGINQVCAPGGSLACL